LFIGRQEKEYEMTLKRTLQSICLLTVHPNTITSVVLQVTLPYYPAILMQHLRRGDRRRVVVRRGHHLGCGWQAGGQGLRGGAVEEMGRWRWEAGGRREEATHFRNIYVLDAMLRTSEK
jgi:hypothetical protein